MTAEVIALDADNNRSEPIFTTKGENVEVGVFDTRRRRPLDKGQAREFLEYVFSESNAGNCENFGYYRMRVAVRNPEFGPGGEHFLFARPPIGTTPIIRLRLPLTIRGKRLRVTLLSCIASKVRKDLVEVEAYANALGKLADAEPLGDPAPLYAERDIIEQGDHYARHVNAMTAEGLHAKSDIAAELAHRDIEIEQLRAALDRYGQHRDGCYGFAASLGSPCTCGLDALVRGHQAPAQPAHRALTIGDTVRLPRYKNRGQHEGWVVHAIRMHGDSVFYDLKHPMGGNTGATRQEIEL